MTLATERLTLRALVTDDAPELCAVLRANRAHFARFMPGLARSTHTVASCHRVIARLERKIAEGEWQLAIFLRGALIGAISLVEHGGRRELGYWIAGTQQGRGYVREAARAVLDATGGDIALETDAENLPSQAVARALGFRGGPERWILRRSFTIPHGIPWQHPASSSSVMTGSPSPAMSVS